MALIDALPQHWPLDDLRAAENARAGAAAVRDAHAAHVAAGEAALAANLDNPEHLDAAIAAAVELTALAYLAGRLPVAEIAPTVGSDALAIAEREILDAQRQAKITPPAYWHERQAWRNLGVGAHRVDPPVATVLDVEAERRFVALLEKGQRLARFVEDWRADIARPGRQAIDCLAAGAALLEQFSAVLATAADAETDFRAADTERRRLGLAWKAPEGWNVDSDPAQFINK